DDIQQTTEWGNRRVSLNCLGVEHVLVEGTVTVGVMTAKRVDECVTAILDAAGWPTGSARAISAADTQLTYYWADDVQPWDALTQLTRSEGAGATMYVEAGVFHWQNRNFRTTNPGSTTPQAQFYDVARHVAGEDIVYRADDLYRTDDTYQGETSGLWFTALDYDPGFSTIRNRATYTVRQR